ncbi:MAG: bifunctional 2-polyprenyl-6-hydroxyphenol methylase/3-demethylubiquinol 3-O-methyltransferase UbiG [Paracoccaceae bacterium]
MALNDQSIYETGWWDGDKRWLRTLRNMVPARLRHFEREIEGWQGRDALDLGCGGGFLAEALVERGARVTGLDPSEGAIESARTHAREAGLDIRYDVGPGEAMPYADDSFDLVLSVDVLEHVSSLDATLDEVRRVLRPGGVFCFDTINRNPVARLAVITAAEDVLGLLPKGTHDPSMFIKPAELRGMLEARGFAVRPFKGLAPTGLNRRLDPTFGVIPLTAIIYVGTARLGEDA